MPDPDDILERLTLARQSLDLDIRRGEETIAEVIGQARAAGLTWDEIAMALGVTRSAAWQKYHARVED